MTELDKIFIELGRNMDYYSNLPNKEPYGFTKTKAQILSLIDRETKKARIQTAKEVGGTIKIRKLSGGEIDDLISNFVDELTKKGKDV